MTTPTNTQLVLVLLGLMMLRRHVVDDADIMRRATMHVMSVFQRAPKRLAIEIVKQRAAALKGMDAQEKMSEIGFFKLLK